MQSHPTVSHMAAWTSHQGGEVQLLPVFNLIRGALDAGLCCHLGFFPKQQDEPAILRSLNLEAC